jgi:hypothetical protein
MDALSYYAPDEQSVPFEVPLIEEKGHQVARLGGEIVFCNGPSFAQLPGERDQALNSDDRGVQSTTMPRYGFPLPARYKPPQAVESRGPRGSGSAPLPVPSGSPMTGLSVIIEPPPPISPSHFGAHFGFVQQALSYIMPSSPASRQSLVPVGSPSSSSASTLSYLPPSPPSSTSIGNNAGSPSSAPSIGPPPIDTPVKPVARAKLPEDDAERMLFIPLLYRYPFMHPS